MGLNWKCRNACFWIKIYQMMDVADGINQGDPIDDKGMDEALIQINLLQDQDISDDEDE